MSFSVPDGASVPEASRIALHRALDVTWPPRSTFSTAHAMALRSALLLTLPALVSATKGVVSLDDLTFDKVRLCPGARAHSSEG